MDRDEEKALRNGPRARFVARHPETWMIPVREPVREALRGLNENVAERKANAPPVPEREAREPGPPSFFCQPNNERSRDDDRERN